jgi:predicted phage tail protein
MASAILVVSGFLVIGAARWTWRRMTDRLEEPLRLLSIAFAMFGVAMIAIGVAEFLVPQIS